MIRDADQILEYPMVDKEPIARWTFGRVSLAGDAAHPMYPRGSNGSAQALIDARVLADLLASGRPIEAALAEYEAVRAPQTARVVLTNRATPPDAINIAVEDRVGDRPFTDLDAVISQAELQAISDRYKAVAGFSLDRF
jgi:2-polyprenyl-6-methoxyphenol hydroxylase-like FAD-dependent oxidoreductase